ncbi:MAG: hypothetical protein WCL34_15035 [Methylococcaceae bacterium]
MNDDDFERLCKSLEQAIAHASGEKVDGVITHHPKKLQVVRKETHAKKYVSHNHHAHNSAMAA